MSHRKVRNPRNNSGGGPGRATERDSCLLPVHSLVPFSAASTAVSLTPNSTLFPRAATEADSWAHFKVRKMKFRILPCAQDLTASNSGSCAVGFVGGIQDTPPATLANIMELLPAVASTSSQQCPTNWQKVPALDLSGPLPWYKTVIGTADSTEEAPGQIVWASTVTNTPTFQIEFKGLFEFKTSLATANTPAAIQARKMLHDYRVKTADLDERERLIRLLAPVIPGLALQSASPTLKSSVVVTSGNLP